MRNSKGQFEKGLTPWNKNTKGVMKAWNKNKQTPEETRKKISESKKGKISPNKGKKLPPRSEETRRKISEKMKGIKRSKETRGKMSESQKGNKHCLGKKNRLGYKNTVEHKRKVSIALSGEKNIHWIDGRTPENHKIRNSIEMRLWRESVFARDNWTCQKCKVRGGELMSHHIRNFAEAKELRTSIENGITFCKICHKEFHHIFGLKKNNQEQINEFLL